MECGKEENENKNRTKRKLPSIHTVKMKRNRLREYKC